MQMACDLCRGKQNLELHPHATHRCADACAGRLTSAVPVHLSQTAFTLSLSPPRSAHTCAGGRPTPSAPLPHALPASHTRLSQSAFHTVHTFHTLLRHPHLRRRTALPHSPCPTRCACCSSVIWRWGTARGSRASSSATCASDGPVAYRCTLRGASTAWTRGRTSGSTARTAPSSWLPSRFAWGF